MKSSIGVAACMFVAPSLAVAGPPGRGPEVQKLGYYIGTWEGHGATKAGPFGPAGKLSSKMTCGWFTGRFQVLCRGEERGPGHVRNFLNILTYDEAKKAYTEYSISSMGESEYDQNGTLVDGKLTYLIHQDIGGKSAHFRYTEDHVSPDMMTYRAEVSLAGAPWRDLAEGKIRKVR